MSSTTSGVSPFMVWLMAVRPRTLPLAVSGVLLGYGLAALQMASRVVPACPPVPVLLLALLTALFLQILSNLANDYGDAVSGADTEERVGPTRVVSTGLSSKKSMLQAIILAAGLAFASGVALVITGSRGDPATLLFFLGLGLAAILAAILYTMGKRPYGYIGLGDIMVCLFFGPVTVCGTAVLCGAELTGALWLAGFATGLFNTAVLNINNMRDIETDRKAGKLTVPVRLGLANAVRYHQALVGGGFLLWLLFWHGDPLRFLAALPFAALLFYSTRCAVRGAGDAANLNRQLRLTVLGTALFNIGITLICMVAIFH